MVQHVREGESDTSEGDFDDTPLMHLTTRKRKMKVNDSSNQVPSTVAFEDVPSASTDDMP